MEQEHGHIRDLEWHCSFTCIWKSIHASWMISVLSVVFLLKDPAGQQARRLHGAAHPQRLVGRWRYSILVLWQFQCLQTAHCMRFTFGFHTMDCFVYINLNTWIVRILFWTDSWHCWHGFCWVEEGNLPVQTHRVVEFWIFRSCRSFHQLYPFL